MQLRSSTIRNRRFLGRRESPEKDRLPFNLYVRQVTPRWAHFLADEYTFESGRVRPPLIADILAPGAEPKIGTLVVEAIPVNVVNLKANRGHTDYVPADREIYPLASELKSAHGVKRSWSNLPFELCNAVNVKIVIKQEGVLADLQGFHGYILAEFPWR